MSTKMQQTLKVTGTSKYVNFIEINLCHVIMKKMMVPGKAPKTS